MTTGPEPEPELTVSDLADAILGEKPTLRGSDIAEAAGITVDDSRRLWRALGFADAADQIAFTVGDRDALSEVVRAGVEAHLDMDTMVRVVRAVGHTLARLADWEVATLSQAVDEFSAAGASPDSVRAGLGMIDSLAPHFDNLLVYAWRRHLAAAVGRIAMLGADDEDLHVAQATVGFADLVQFTALSNELDEHELGDLVEVFESRCSDVIADHNGRVIKTLGDSVLFIESDPVQAIDIALDIIAVIGRDERLPDVRLGLATGPVVLRMGDVYGPPVNLAARFTSVARRNRVIIDERTADLLPPDEFETRQLPARPIRGFGDLEPVTVRRTRPRH
jgi:adenylate cyclase